MTNPHDRIDLVHVLLVNPRYHEFMTVVLSCQEDIGSGPPWFWLFSDPFSAMVLRSLSQGWAKKISVSHLWLTNPHTLILWTSPLENFFPFFMNLERSLILCPFSKIIELPLGPMSSKPWVLFRAYKSRYVFLPEKHTLNPVKKKLVFPIILCHYCTYEHPWPC